MAFEHLDKLPREARTRPCCLGTRALEKNALFPDPEIFLVSWSLFAGMGPRIETNAGLCIYNLYRFLLRGDGRAFVIFVPMRCEIREFSPLEKNYGENLSLIFDLRFSCPGCCVQEPISFWHSHAIESTKPRDRHKPFRAKTRTLAASQASSC